MCHTVGSDMKVSDIKVQYFCLKHAQKKFGITDWLAQSHLCHSPIHASFAKPRMADDACTPWVLSSKILNL